MCIGIKGGQNTGEIDESVSLIYRILMEESFFTKFVDVNFEHWPD